MLPLIPILVYKYPLQQTHVLEFPLVVSISVFMSVYTLIRSHRTKFCPNFRTTLELTATEASAPPTEPDLVSVEQDSVPEQIPGKDNPPTPQEAERIIATLLPW